MIFCSRALPPSHHIRSVVFVLGKDFPVIIDGTAICSYRGGSFLIRVNSTSIQVLCLVGVYVLAETARCQFLQ